MPYTTETEVRGLIGNLTTQQVSAAKIALAIAGAEAEINRFTGRNGDTNPWTTGDGIDDFGVIKKIARLLAASEALTNISGSEQSRRSFRNEAYEMLKDFMGYEEEAIPYTSTAEPSTWPANPTGLVSVNKGIKRPAPGYDYFGEDYDLGGWGY